MSFSLTTPDGICNNPVYEQLFPLKWHGHSNDSFRDCTRVEDWLLCSMTANGIYVVSSRIQKKMKCKNLHNFLVISFALLVVDNVTLVKIKVSYQQQWGRKLRGLTSVKIFPMICLLMMTTQISQALKCLGIMASQKSQFPPSSLLTLLILC